jgi:NAD(P)-dependent dehydrogenase (short-subunit alcohol dehydrogenase family)
VTDVTDHAGETLTRLFDVRGKVALVTGGASGLGYAFSSVLAECGAVVYVADVDEPALDNAVKELPAASGVVLDVSDGEQVHEAVREIARDRGRLDIVFANAGVARGTPPLVPSGTADEFSWADYERLIDVNLHGVVHTVRAAASAMKRQRSGSIVATASTAGLRNDPFVPYSYAIAKAGVVNFVKQAAHDLARWNVRVNAIAPGPFKTNLGKNARAAGESETSPVNDSPADGSPADGSPAGDSPVNAGAEDRWNAVIPLGRMGDPSEIRGLALLLASDASSFMTGGVYPVDGGALLQGPSLPPL